MTGASGGFGGMASTMLSVGTNQITMMAAFHGGFAEARIEPKKP
jgi:hypothetical protein